MQLITRNPVLRQTCSQVTSRSTSPQRGACAWTNPQGRAASAKIAPPSLGVVELGMSFSDTASSSSSVPSWAQRATEPLVPSLDLAGVKKDVQRDLKEIKRASDDIGRLAKKRASKECIGWQEKI